MKCQARWNFTTQKARISWKWESHLFGSRRRWARHPMNAKHHVKDKPTEASSW